MPAAAELRERTINQRQQSRDVSQVNPSHVSAATVHLSQNYRAIGDDEFDGRFDLKL